MYCFVSYSFTLGTDNSNRTMYAFTISVLLLLFVLSNQHFVTHLKFNFVLCIIQN